eukprot:scaffold114397_cov28-Tisochrysis_lutea.AAC.7
MAVRVEGECGWGWHNTAAMWACGMWAEAEMRDGNGGGKGGGGNGGAGRGDGNGGDDGGGRSGGDKGGGGHGRSDEGGGGGRVGVASGGTQLLQENSGLECDQIIHRIPSARPLPPLHPSIASRAMAAPQVAGPPAAHMHIERNTKAIEYAYEALKAHGHLSMDDVSMVATACNAHSLVRCPCTPPQGIPRWIIPRAFRGHTCALCGAEIDQCDCRQPSPHA